MKAKKGIPNNEDVKYEITVNLKNNQAVIQFFLDGKLQPKMTTILNNGDQYSIILDRMLKWSFESELSTKQI